MSAGAAAIPEYVARMLGVQPEERGAHRHAPWSRSAGVADGTRAVMAARGPPVGVSGPAAAHDPWDDASAFPSFPSTFVRGVPGGGGGFAARVGHHGQHVHHGGGRPHVTPTPDVAAALHAATHVHTLRELRHRQHGAHATPQSRLLEMQQVGSTLRHHGALRCVVFCCALLPSPAPSTSMWVAFVLL
jgi:hypothetical protein